MHSQYLYLAFFTALAIAAPTPIAVKGRQVDASSNVNTNDSTVSMLIYSYKAVARIKIAKITFIGSMLSRLAIERKLLINIGRFCKTASRRQFQR